MTDLTNSKNADTLETDMPILELPETDKAHSSEEVPTSEEAGQAMDTPATPNESPVAQLETNAEAVLDTDFVADQQGNDEEGWRSVPLTITVNEESEDGTQVPTKLLIYPGNAVKKTSDEVADISKEQSGIPKENEPSVLFQLTTSHSQNSSEEPAFQEEPNQADSVFPCNLCDFVSEHKHNLKTHMLVHTKPTVKEYFKCEECDHITPLKYNLKTHMKKHAKLQDLSENDIFRCKDCDYVSAYKHDLQTHAKKHLTEKPFQCDECDFSSIYKHSLLHHVSSKHKRNRPHKCTICSYSSARKQDLKTHLATHSADKPYKCELCDYGTPYRQSFKAHMDRHLGNKMYKCDQDGCDFSTTTLQNLKSHLARHSNVKQYQCAYCDYSATHKSQLFNHEAKHTDQQRKTPKTFCCTLCPYRTPHKFSLKRHQETHSKNRAMPEKSFYCDQCGYQTGYKSSLKRHMAKHSDVKPFKCGHCDYSAINMTQMHVHIAKHTGIRPFKCDKCDYSTANKQHLVSHMSKHSNVRLNCPLCEFSTVWKQRLSIHIKQHHIHSGELQLPQQATTKEQTLPSQEERQEVIDTVGLEESGQQLYHIEHSETSEALSQLSNVIAAYQQQIQDDDHSQPEGAEQQSSANDPSAETSDVRDQMLLIPTVETSQAQDATVVIVEGSQMTDAHTQEQQVHLIIDDHTRPILDSVPEKTSSTHYETPITTSTEIAIDAMHSEVISSTYCEPTLVTNVEEIYDEQTETAESERTLVSST